MTKAVLHYHSKGMRNRDIAKTLHCSTGVVSALIHYGKGLRGTQRVREQLRRRDMLNIEIDRLDVARLTPYAEQRRISVNKLIRQLVNVIAEADLVDAVLDDNPGRCQ